MNVQMESQDRILGKNFYFLWNIEAESFKEWAGEIREGALCTLTSEMKSY